MTALMQDIDACVFEAYGTLFDFTATAACDGVINLKLPLRELSLVLLLQVAAVASVTALLLRIFAARHFNEALPTVAF